MANAPSYIPPKDADFDPWFLNFSTLITANPVTYGLIAADALLIAAQYAIWHPAFLLATNPATRTTPTVQAKTIARINAIGVVRPYAQSIAKNPAVADADKLDLALNLPNNVPVAIPPLLDVASLIVQPSAPGMTQFQFRSSSDPTSKAKPFGAIGLQVLRGSGVAPVASPDDCVEVARVTKSPFTIQNAPVAAGQVMTFFARWIQRSGASGEAYSAPWSAAVIVIAS